MTDDADTRRYSLDELKARRAALGSRTRPDAPARAVDAAFWREARLVMPPAGRHRFTCGWIAMCWRGSASRERGICLG
jgi:hypothetical protein